MEEEEDAQFLSDHTQSMRKASHHCIKLFDRLQTICTCDRERGDKDILEHKYGNIAKLQQVSLEQHQFRRQEAYRKFWSSPPLEPPIFDEFLEKSDLFDDTKEPTKQSITIKHLRVHPCKRLENYKEKHSSTVLSSEQVRYFQDHYQNLNIPCLIEGLDETSHFDFVNRCWRRGSDIEDKSPFNKNTSQSFRSSKVNRQWFREALGEDDIVPLRYNPKDDTKNSMLDEDGRAKECETLEVSMNEWIELLERPEMPDSCEGEPSYPEQNEDCDENDTKIVYYLKDWHLQQRFPLKSPVSLKQDDESPHVTTDQCSLYGCPEFFGYDLLNSFLTRFTNGDYRFCYWGPRNSFTGRHSDVLHSFSWSYNVVGTKEWTFYRDQDTMETRGLTGPEGGTKTFTIRQETGQTIFVPAMWQHQVVNLEETISINHNWITTSNLDLVWDCLRVEMVAIRKELQGWNPSSHDDTMGGLDQNMEACENMLRGCIGLDVTCFLLMILLRIVEVLTELLDGERKEICEYRQTRLLFDAYRLSSALRVILAMEGDVLRLEQRLHAVLQSDDLSQRVLTVMQQVIDWVH